MTSRTSIPTVRTPDTGVETWTRGRLREPAATVSLAIVHHANQYLITGGYENRYSLADVLGCAGGGSTGLARVLQIHRNFGIPANIHISGTLLESIAWHCPDFLDELRELHSDGLIEFVGSCYAQNIMRFFSYYHNLRQLNEELELYRHHLGVDPERIRVFWPPERVWDTGRMAPVLTDPLLLNRGYRCVLLDDRVLLPGDGEPRSPRGAYDSTQRWDPELFHACYIRNGQGLVALPIATNLRQSIPPVSDEQWEGLDAQLEWLARVQTESCAGDLIAIYADDMEKSAGVGWDERGPARFEEFLRSLREYPQIRPVKLSDWVEAARIAGRRTLEVGAFRELAQDFQAGEDYEKWFYDVRFAPYRAHLSWSEKRVEELNKLGGDAALMALAEKHLMASNWETGWHTPSCGAHGCADSDGGPSAWIKALASHSRHAAIIAEAAFWMRHRDDEVHAYLQDLDNDGEAELILKNDKLFAVFTARWGGRLIYLFRVDGPEGAMVVGNPSDDWNLMEELNKYMEVPRNHPGALVDAGLEHDRYSVAAIVFGGATARARLRNEEAASPAYGLVKEVSLKYGESTVQVAYRLPEGLSGVEVEFGLSPGYLELLRGGRHSIREYGCGDAHGWASDAAAVWVRAGGGEQIAWTRPRQEEFGHGRCLGLAASCRQFSIWIGVDAAPVELDKERGDSSWVVTVA